jgi:hypothetical protein
VASGSTLPLQEPIRAVTTLAGTSTPTGDLRALAGQANILAERVSRRARHAGALRADLKVNDIAMLFEQITAVRIDDPERTTALRRRYVALLLDALRLVAVSGRLPGPPPTSDELGARWRPAAANGAGRS